MPEGNSQLPACLKATHLCLKATHNCLKAAPNCLKATHLCYWPYSNKEERLKAKRSDSNKHPATSNATNKPEGTAPLSDCSVALP